jgi:hypothetical protein
MQVQFRNSDYSIDIYTANNKTEHLWSDKHSTEVETHEMAMIICPFTFWVEEFKIVTQNILMR